MLLSTPLAHNSFVLKSSFDVLDSLVDDTMHFFMAGIPDEELVYNIVLVATELVTNAIEHGNASDENKQVFVDFAYDQKEAALAVRDEGPGFDPKEVENPLNQEQLLAEGGRGIFLVEQIADRVEYKDRGKTVVTYFTIPPAS